ncbi:hypothetical protein HJC23_003989 [Cyclotella cryptica]|eukprot:CCRYP_001965-RA/>CCRYP_001965-RA protein AED:0.35 eAED:0.35 QI:0/-1/0/1/-1/1/1/0/140
MSCRRFTCSTDTSILRGAAIQPYVPGLKTLSVGPCLKDAVLSPSSHSAFQETRRCMSKYLSKSASKRLPLNTKRAKKGYYKGKGCTSEGRLTSKGKFIADPLKKLQLIVPDLTGFPLKPYIAKTISKVPPENRIDMQAGR